MANKKFVAKNGIAVGTGHTTTDIIDQDGHITANTVTISGTLLNATAFAGTANNASYLEGSNGSYYTGYADNKAANAYSNATSYADNKAANAYSNAIAYSANATNISSGTLTANVLPTSGVTAATYGNSSSIPVITIDATGRITSATTNAVAGVTGFTYTPSNATFIITTGAGSTFPASISSANDSVAGIVKVLDSVSNTDIYIAASANSVKTAYDNATTAYSNAATYADNKAANAYSNATSYAASIAGTAYSNATTFASSAAATAYSNAVSAASSSAATAYSNATTFAANATNISSGTLAELRLPFRMDQNVRTNDTVSFGNMTITGNLTVTGTTVTVNANNLSIQDNMIYLNSNSSITNPDLGIAGNYNDGTYRHAGFFRDASDGVWKVFDQYLPEPDASPYIDTANASFRIANFQANVVTAASFSGNGASVTSVDAATVGGNTAGTLRSYSDSTAATAYSNATSYAATIAGTAYSNAVSYFTTNYTASDVLTKIKTVDGAGSGLDADLLDGQSGSYYAANSSLSSYLPLSGGTLTGGLTGTSGTFTSSLYSRKSQTAGNYTTAALWTESYDNTTTGIAFHISGNVGKFLEMRTNGILYWNGDTVWHSGNDGSGSGLDSDLLDGQQGSYYAANSSLSSYLPLTGGTLSGTLIGGTATPTGSVIGQIRAYGTNGSGAYMGASDDAGRTAFFGVDSSNYAMFGALTNTDVVIRANNNEYFRVHTGGYTTSSGSSRAPIFYDSANTSFYLDPASTSVLSILNIPGQQTINTTTPGTTSYNLNFIGQAVADYAQAITWSWSTSGAQAGIYVQSSGAYGTKMYLATTDSFATGSKTAIAIDHSGITNFVRATPTVTGNAIWHAGNDGAGSGLDADLLDGLNQTTAATASTIVARDSAGDVYQRYGFSVHFNQSSSNSENPTISQVMVTNGSDNYLRKASLAHLVSQIGGSISNLGSVGGRNEDTGRNTAGSLTHFSTFTYTNSHGLTYPYHLQATNGGQGFELAVDWISTTSSPIKIRSLRDCCQNWSSWSTIWTSTTDGSGSGLDADLLDGFGWTSGHTVSFGSTTVSGTITQTGPGRTSSVGPSSYDARFGSSDLWFWFKSIEGAGSSGYPGAIQFGRNDSAFSWPIVLNPRGGNVGVNTYSADYALHVAGTGFASSDFRAPIFYDSNNTAYFLEPGGDSSVQAAVLNGNIRINPRSESWAEGISFNMPSQAVWGGIRWVRSYSGSGGNWALGYLGVESNNDMAWWSGDSSVKWRLNHSGDVTASGSSRAPIFYDSNNTAYYVDPTSYTSLYGGMLIQGEHASTQFKLRLPAANNGAATGLVNLQMWCSEPGNSWDGAGFGYNVDNNLNEGGNVPVYYFGRPNTNFGQAYMRMTTDGNWYFYNTPSGSNTRYTTMRLAPTGFIENYASIRAPIFYDQDNTAYYIDPNTSGTSIRVGGYAYFGIAVDGDGTVINHDQIWTPSGQFHIQYSGGGNLNMCEGGGYAYVPNTSMRAPIFYDHNDTGYYIDPNSTSNSALRVRGGALYGPNVTWGAYLYVGTDGRVGSSATVAVTNGNLHMDCQNGYAMYLNWYSNNNIYTGTGVNFGIGSDSASYKLHVHGTIYSTSNIIAASDERLKENVLTIENAIEKIKQIRGVTYTRNDLEDKVKRHAGVIAQEVEKVLPEVVDQTEDGIKNVAYGNMVGLLIEAIKEQQKQIEELKAALLNK